jgi:hypothetical protein
MGILLYFVISRHIKALLLYGAMLWYCVGMVKMHETEKTMTAQEYVVHSNRPKGSKGLIERKQVEVVRGRPSQYKEEYINDVRVYLDGCNDRYEEFIKARTERGDTFGQRLKVDLPTRTGVATYIGTTQETLTKWGKLHPVFLAVLKEVDQEQRTRLLNNGLSKAYDPTICKLLLASNHGISDKIEVEHSFSVKDLVEGQENREAVAWDDSSSHLQGLQEASPDEEEEDVI